MWEGLQIAEEIGCGEYKFHKTDLNNFFVWGLIFFSCKDSFIRSCVSVSSPAVSQACVSVSHSAPPVCSATSLAAYRLNRFWWREGLMIPKALSRPECLPVSHCSICRDEEQLRLRVTQIWAPYRCWELPELARFQRTRCWGTQHGVHLMLSQLMKEHWDQRQLCLEQTGTSKALWLIWCAVSRQGHKSCRAQTVPAHIAQPQCGDVVFPLRKWDTQSLIQNY